MFFWIVVIVIILAVAVFLIKTFATKPIPPCTLSEWSPWSACSKPCGSGGSMRQRTMQNSNGKCPPSALSEQKTCNTQPCCEMTPWSEWSKCSATCGSGSMTRTRKVAKLLNPQGTCDLPLSEHKSCDHLLPTCPPAGTIHDCKVSEWSEWSECSKPCGGGQQQRTRQNLRGQGELCNEPELIQYRPCNPQTCPTPIHCNQGTWTDWSTCSQECDDGQNAATAKGTQSRQRRGVVLSNNVYGAITCPPDMKMEETRECNRHRCVPVDCKIEWSPWMQKYLTGESIIRKERIVTQPKYGGQPCRPTERPIESDYWSEFQSKQLNNRPYLQVDPDWQQTARQEAEELQRQKDAAWKEEQRKRAQQSNST